MKDGISYFPLDCELDSKFELIEAEFGLQGFAVVVKLLQRIYGGEGYYCEWTNEVALLFAKRNSTGGSVVSEIVEASIKRGIFDKDMFERYGILTSKGIQLRYLKAVDRRKQVKIKKQYLLVECALLPKNVCIIEESVNIIQKNADISQQRKEEESKVKKSNVYKGAFSDSSLESAFQFYLLVRSQNWGEISEEQVNALREDLLSLSSDLAEQKAILNKAAAGGWKNWSRW